MIPIETSTILTAARYRTEYVLFPCKLLDQEVRSHFDIDNVSYDEFMQKLSVLIKKGSSKDFQSGQEWAFRQLLFSDLEKWKRECDTYPKESNFDTELAKNNQLIIADIREYLNLPYEKPSEVHLVERLPGRFANNFWHAMNARPGFDFDVPEGIYFVKSKVSELSNTLLYHEHLHVASQTVPNDSRLHFIEWLDEGIADVGSWLFAARNLEDWEVAVITNIRFYQDIDQDSRIRGWSTRNVAFLILKFGMNFFRFILSQRCASPEKVDWTRLLNEMKKVSSLNELTECFDNRIPNKAYEYELRSNEKLVCEYVLGFTENPLVLSPLAYWSLKTFCETSTISENEFAFSTFKSLAANMPANAEEIKKSCSELGLLGIQSSDDGLRSWDMIGYFKNELNNSFIKSTHWKAQNRLFYSNNRILPDF